MRRRELLIIVLVGATAITLRSRAAAKLPLIGWLSTATPESNPINQGVLVELQHLGWVEGNTVEYDSRFATGDPRRFPEMAADLVARKADIIYAPSVLATKAAQRVTKTIPIVTLANDIEVTGLVNSLAHPDGNTTGVSILASELDVKRLELLLEMVPRAKRFALLAQSRTDPSVARLMDAAPHLGIELALFEAPDRDAVGPALDSIAVAGVDAVNVLTSSILYFARKSIMERMAAARLPAIYQWPEYAADGALIAYGPRQSLISQLLAQQIDRLLRGAPVASVPVIQPSKYDLVINAQTARKLGLSIPPSLLARADDVIE